MTVLPLESEAPESRGTGRVRRWLGPVLVLLLFAAAAWALRDELHDFRYRDVARQIWTIPGKQLGFAVVLTLLAYATLPGYDALGLAYVGHRIPLRRVAFGSFIAYGLSQTLGFPLVTGGTIRYRFWSAWGLSTAEIGQAVSFAGATFTLGVVLVTGIALLLEPVSVGRVLELPTWYFRPIGALCVIAVGAYLVWSAISREPIRIRGWQFPVPPPGLALAQLTIAALDWTLAGAVLYVLLPNGMVLGFWPFLGAFLLSQTIGLLSHVPGGLGVFETLMLLLLHGELPADVTAATLVLYRVVYYLIPFALALVMLAGYEIARQGERVAAVTSRVASTTGSVAAVAMSRWVPTLLPTVLSATTLLAGGVLLFSGATPSVHGRVNALDRVLPLGVIELSHFMASLTGAGLVVLAWAIRRRLDAAYGLAIASLVVGIIASLLKGLDWEEAAILVLVLAVLLPSRRAFYRKAALTAEPLEPGWIIAMVLVVGASIWLGLFSFKHVEYTNELWWRFTPRADAPRFLRASIGVVGSLFVFGLMRLLRTAEAEPAQPSEQELARAADVVKTSQETSASLALLGDKALLFGSDGTSLLMYGVEGRSWVALGDPVGTAAERTELAWRFHELADAHGAWTVFYQVSAANLPVYIDLGLTLLKLGEEAKVPLERFGLEGNARKSLRRSHKDVQVKSGATFELADASCVSTLMSELRAISDEWLTAKKTREKGFSLGRFDERYLLHFPMALVRIEGKLVAFANVLLGADKAEISVDLMRHTDDAPAGIMDYLFVELMLWGKAQGYASFNLGMAPLSGFEDRQLASRWSRLGSLLYRHGEHFYNFQGLRRYKDKYDPIWQPRYLASPGGLALPRILTNVATLIAGGIRGVVAK